jgi:hypothetical protein
MQQLRLRRRKFAAFALVAMSGGMAFSSCGADIRHNLIAGSLSYVQSGAEAFWENFMPQDDIWSGIFGRDE